MKMDNQLALVTGANRGIGLETVKQLATLGITTILTSRNKQAGQQIAHELSSQGLPVHFHALDVSKADQVDQLYNYVKQTFGKLDILINNAGVYLDEGISIQKITHETMETSLSINVLGPFYLCQKFLPLMQQNGYGRIVNISSGYGSMNRLSGDSTGSYKVSKIALNALTRLFANSVNGSHIKINSIDPGWVRTDMGGPSAPRSTQQAAQGIIWAATLPADGPNGGFFYDKQPAEW